MVVGSCCNDDATVTGLECESPLLRQNCKAALFSHGQYARRRQRQRPAARKRTIDVSKLAMTVLCLLLCLGPCTATATNTADGQKSIGDLLFDTRTPPAQAVRLIGRAVEGGSSTGTASSQTTSTTASRTTDTATALPSAFDSSMGDNFTDASCPAFFQKFLSNQTFNDCVPLSLLLQTSTSFFDIQRSPVRLAQTLADSCNVNVTRCNDVMASLARQIELPSNCGADLQRQNPMVQQAYQGFVAYEPVYQASCLINSDTGNYCFSDALTNASSPTNAYVYYLPLGVTLPSSTKPTCSTCLINTMSVFAVAAANPSQPVSHVYAAAAKMIDQTCGVDFVAASVPRASGATAHSGPWILGIMALAIAVMTVLV